MQNFYYPLTLTVRLLAASLFLFACSEEQESSPTSQKETVQFILNPNSAYSHSVDELNALEKATAVISVSASTGATILTDYEVEVFKKDDTYITGPIELQAGSYTVTDFLIVNDTVDLFVAPKSGAALASSDADVLPFPFSVVANGAAKVNLRVISVGDEDLQKFGYGSSKAKANALSIEIVNSGYSSMALTNATAELRQHKKLLNVFSLTSGINTISLGGNTKEPYTITVYTNKAAKTQTFNLKQVKKENGKNPLRLTLEPALVVSIESYVEAGNEYEEYYDFTMNGNGAININWGDGEENSATLPFHLTHEYLEGSYALIVTGDLDQITDFAGFSYGTIMTSISGLTNLTSLKVYNPSWGAVPIKVDLSNCNQLEEINIAKYGAPYEPINLSTDFKLPSAHQIHTFIFDGPSFDSEREFLSEEELETLVDKVYSNAVNRNINNGKFFVNPIATTAPETQQKIDALENDYGWAVGFNDDIYEAYSSKAGRSAVKSDEAARREKWVKERFPNGEQILQRARQASTIQ